MHPEGHPIRYRVGDIVSTAQGDAQIQEVWQLASYPYVCMLLGDRENACCGDLIWYADRELELIFRPETKEDS